jgi:U3 small nucleolar RNA-associated protein 22
MGIFVSPWVTFHQHQHDSIMAQSPPKRRKLRHGSEEADSADGDSESNDEEASKQPAARQKHSQAVDESALYSGGLYNSSLFKLQIDEMLAQVQPNYEKRMPGVDDALRQLKTLIEAIEDREMLPVCF